MASKITKSFLEDAVRESISDFTVGAGSKKGDNVGGNLLAITATGQSGTVYNLVYKYLSEDPAHREWATKSAIFRTEMSAYSHLVPRLVKFIEEKSGITYTSVTPKIYGGLYDGENDYILLEDVRPAGYTMQDKFCGYNLEETCLVLKKIAEFHAASYFFIKEEGERYFREDKELKKFVRDHWIAESPEMEEFCRKLFFGCYSHCVEFITKKDAKLGEKLLAAVSKDHAFDTIRSLIGSTKHFPCLIHGDLWLNNIMIKYENEDRTKPVDLKFIDFQMTRCSDIFEELTYFLLCSTTPEFRKENYTQILKVYYDSFTGFLLDTLKTHLPWGFNRGYFVNTMHELMLPGFAFMSFAIPMQLADPIDFPSMIGEAAAALDIDMAKLIPPPQEDNQGSPPLEDTFLMIKLRNFMLYKQLEKSPKGTERMMRICQELVDLKLI